MSRSNADTTSRWLNEIRQGLADIENEISRASRASILSQKIARLRTQINAFEQAPKALDGDLQQYITCTISIFFSAKTKSHESSAWHAIVDESADLVYVMAKVRGYRTVANALPSDVYMLPRIVTLLESEKTQKSPSESYFLLLWLSRLVLVPFPLKTVKVGVDQQIFHISLRFLALHSTASKTQQMASTVLSSLVTRPDCEILFRSYTESALLDWPVMAENLKLGHLITLNQMLKRCHGPNLSKLVSEIHSGVILHEIALAKHDDRGGKVNTTVALYLIKVAAKCARFFVARADYDTAAALVNSSSDLMQHMGEFFDASLRECMAKNLAKTTSRLAGRAVNYASQLVSYMLRQMRIQGLEPDAGFVLDLHIDATSLSVPRFHTVLLYIGFLALTRSLPSEYIPAVFALCHQTCFISKRKFAFVQTAQIRDASCFCLWAIFRQIGRPEFERFNDQFPQLAPTLFMDLINVSIFDEDFTMRRCGIAVLQEFVGRFGNCFVKDLLKTDNSEQIGQFTISFIEQFAASTVGSLRDSHKILERLLEMGFSVNLFFEPLCEEILAESASYELQKLGSVHLARIISEIEHRKVSEVSPNHLQEPDSKLSHENRPRDPPKLALESGKNLDLSSIIKILLRSMKIGGHGALYALAELKRHGLLDPDSSETVLNYIENIELKRHFNPAYMGESIMHYVNSQMRSESRSGTASQNKSKTRSGTNIEERSEISTEVKSTLKHASFDSPKMESLLAAIQRLDPSDCLISELGSFYTACSSMSQSRFTSICRQIRQGNMLVAASIMHASLDTQKMRQIATILGDLAVDAEIRATLVSQINSRRVGEAGIGVFGAVIVSLLDDYTISEQGDVGSKVRSAAILHIEKNLEYFSRTFPELTAKLVRLSGETIDKLRILSFRVLCQILERNEYHANAERYSSDYDAYFSDLFRVYRSSCASSEELNKAFWIGIVHSAAATTGANSMVNSAFRQVLELFRNSDISSAVCSTLVGNLRMAPGLKVSALSRREQKTLSAIMLLVVKIFDSGIDPPNSDLLEPLFVRAYNLHINTTNTARIGLTIRIFQHISVSLPAPRDLQIKCRKRLCWLCCFHANGQVRALAADALFESVTDRSEAVKKEGCDEKTTDIIWSKVEAGSRNDNFGINECSSEFSMIFHILEETNWESAKPGSTVATDLETGFKKLERVLPGI